MRKPTYAILLGFTLAGCSGSQFAGGGTGIVGGAKKKESSGPTNKEKDEELGNVEEEDETDTAEEPVMVSGAFLTCEQDDAFPSDQLNLTAGCVAMVGEERLDLTQYEEVRWSVLDVFNIDLVELSARFVPASADSRWHVTIPVPRLGVELLKVKLTLKRHGKEAPLYSPIVSHGGNGDGSSEPDVDTDSSASTPNIKEFGQNGDYQLGDDSYENQGSYCSTQLQKIDLSGASLTFTITVKTATKLGISMGHICGVNRSYNTIKVRDADSKNLHESTIPRYSRDVALPKLDLQEGTYTLELYSPKWEGGGKIKKGDRDDFVIGDFRFVYDGDVEIAEPVANQLIE